MTAPQNARIPLPNDGGGAADAVRAEHAAPKTDAHSSESNWDEDLLRDLPEAPSDPELARLREMLFARETALLEKLAVLQKNKLHDAKKVSEVIAEAVLLRSGKDTQLSMALEPLVDAIIKESLRKRQSDFVNALFPLMGPLLRRSIAETFRSMLENFSKSVEMAFSWQGLRWRFEAWRSGKPFSEIVLLHTLVYRVEQVFLIHSDTGLVLSHVVNEGAASQDADMVSAMLTAIQDFVRDSFASGDEGELDSLRAGEFTIFMEKSPKAYLACVVRGTPPATFRALLRETLELMLVEFSESLEDFSGDTGPFLGAARHLEALLVARYADENAQRIPLWAKAVPIALLASALGAGAFFYHQKIQFENSMQEALLALRSEPGLMIINVAPKSGKPWEVITFKDALTPDPKDLLSAKGVDPALFSFKNVPFISHDAAIIKRRAHDAIKTPATVTMEYDGKDTLVFSGSAPIAWTLKARETALGVSGIKHVDMQRLHDPRMDRLTALVKEVEETVVEFPTNKDVPTPEHLQTLKSSVDTLVEVEKIAKEMGLAPSLTVYGHADATGLEKRNYEISLARTRTVAALLYAKGSSMPVAMYGMGAEHPKGGAPTDDPGSRPKREDQASRRIEFRVHLARSANAEPILR